MLTPATDIVTDKVVVVAVVIGFMGCMPDRGQGEMAKDN